MWEQENITIDDNGVESEFYCETKHFDLPSEYGINGGRISKLYVCKIVNGIRFDPVIHYDREWNLEPKSEVGKKLLQILIDKYN